MKLDDNLNNMTYLYYYAKLSRDLHTFLYFLFYLASESINREKHAYCLIHSL